MDLTVIIDPAQTPELVPDCLAALNAACETMPVQVLVADAEIASTGERLNKAAREAASDLILFIRPWVLPHCHSVRELRETLVRDLSIGCAAPGVLNVDGNQAATEFILIQDECKRKPIDVLLRPADSGRKEEWPMPPHDGVAFKADAIMVRKTAFWGIGGWDESFEGACLDLTMGLALKEQQWRCVYVREAVMISRKSEDNSEIDVEQNRDLVFRWFGRFLPHAFRTADGVIRGHPWWPTEAALYPAGIQRVHTPFDPLPCGADYRQGDVPGERCSIIIVTYNSMESVHACLTSVFDNIGLFDEVVVVDNGSRDGTPDLLEAITHTDPRIKLILNQENLGFSAACNLGIEASHGEYVVLLNPDTVVTEGWLGRMREYFQDSRVGAVGPISNGAWGLQGYSYHFPRKTPGNLSPSDVHKLATQVNSRRGIESKLLIGFCLMVRRTILDEVGHLDPDLFLGCDDLDLCWRLRLAGYKLIIASDVFVLHRVHVSFKSEKPEVVTELSRRSYLAFARKLEAHYGRGNIPSEADLWGIDWFERQVTHWAQAA